MDSRQLKTVAERKFEVRTRSEQSSNSHRCTRHDTDSTVLSCLVWRCELSRPDHPTSAFSVGVCRAVQTLAVRPPDALRRRTHLSGRQLTPPHQTRQDRRACLSTAAVATQARQAATPSRPTAHTQRRCTPRKMSTRCGLLHMTKPDLLL